MNKVISINLNGNAYQVEEQGFEALNAYLENARRQLTDNPDRAEILADLEQAVADKCNRFLRSGKTVVTGPEVAQILEEMGPVRDAEDEAEEGEADGSACAGDDRTAGGGQSGPAYGPRKLYRLKDDKMVEGVCSGIAAYLGIDPTFVRIIFVLLLIFSNGIIAIVYLVLVMIIPEAKTPEEHAAAHGAPFDARDVMERARVKFEEFKESTGKAQKQKSGADYWRGRDRNNVNKGFSTVLTVVLCIVAIFVMLKFLYWPISGSLLYQTGLYVYNPWISVVVLLVLIYALSRLIKNITESKKEAGSLLAGVLKFCLVILVIIFAVHMFPVIFWLFRWVVDMFRHIVPPWHW